MKRKTVYSLLISSLLCLFSCGANDVDPEKDLDHTIGLDTDYETTETLIDGGGRHAKVFLLLGQSNMTGCSYSSYLKKGISEEKYQEYENGYENIKTVFCSDNHSYCSEGEFVTTGLNCAAGSDRFGPETGIAEKLSQSFPDETIFFIKYAMSGFSLNYHWLTNYERGEIYKASIKFIKQYMDTIRENNYEAAIDAIIWMQGESDTNEYKTKRYLENQTKFASYLREDLANYQNSNGVYFIDAEISDSPYNEPTYRELNQQKVRFSELSPLNIYVPTISEGLTTLYEPEGNPDLGHYDAMSELKLGHLLGEAAISIY